MKKTLVSALTTALVVGAASTTFAAANPFEDVPADHWAYDAVAQLAKDGVVEGYGDGTYVGDAAITRYEMAQMVAKAMTKSDLKHADKAMVDKLAAEFADELNNLGVRVAKLEKKVDNVKWNGELRYRYGNMRVKDKGRAANTKDIYANKRGSQNNVLLRLNIAAEINDHWTGKARVDYSHNMKTAANTTNTDIKLTQAWAEGVYGNTVIKLGKLYYKTASDYGMFLDERVSGAQVIFGKDVKVALTAGRYNFDNQSDYMFWSTAYDENIPKEQRKAISSTGSYQGIEIYNNRKEKFTWGIAYHHVKSTDPKWSQGYPGYSGTNWGDANVWSIGLGYKFDKNFNIEAVYLKNTKKQFVNLPGKYRTAYNIQLNYKGAKKEQKGSWGAFVAYRQIGPFAVLNSTYDANNSTLMDGYRGFEIGAQYTFVKNIQGTLKLFTGKEMYTCGQMADRSMHTLFGQLDFWF